MKAIVVAILLFAAPAVAQPHGASDPASSGGANMREPNLANPQAQTNQAAQPSNARETQPGPNAGQAPSIPTPTLGRQMTPTR